MNSAKAGNWMNILIPKTYSSDWLNGWAWLKMGGPRPTRAHCWRRLCPSLLVYWDKDNSSEVKKLEQIIYGSSSLPSVLGYDKLHFTAHDRCTDGLMGYLTYY